MAAVGRILVGGHDAGGAGVAVAPRVVMTARHVVRDRGDEPVHFRPAGGPPVPVERVEEDEQLDAAVLHLAGAVDDWLPLTAPMAGARWRVDSPPPGNDPPLHGHIAATAVPIVDGEDEPVEVVQLLVDEQLGDHHGYSGSGVLDSLGRAVVGILIQQQPLRVPVPLGVAAEAANVLYAVPVWTAVARLGVATSTGPPLRFDVPRPPSGMVDRPELLDRVVDAVTEPGPGEDRPVVRLWGYGGMGKTTLARQLAHDERVWRAFPGGILELSAGEGASVLQVTDRLWTRIATGGRSLPEALSGEPLLVVLDGVLDAGLVGEVVATVPEEVTVVVTTRGTPLEATRVGRPVVSVPVGALSRGEAVRALARDVARAPEVDEALDRLAAALGRWALLLDMAATELHGDELQPDDPDDLPAAPAPRPPAVLLAHARRLEAECSADPTALDDPDSQERSFDRMLRRSLGRLPADDQDRFLDLAVYPAAAKLTLAVLRDLWGLGQDATRRRMLAFRRVGLASLPEVDPPTIALHDLIAAWLHREGGPPDDPRHRRAHQRLASMSVGANGEPGGLTAERAAWLDHHLRHTGVPDDAAHLLKPGWRPAYRLATGGDAAYLSALRELSRQFLELARADPPAGGDATRPRARAAIARLLHAHIGEVAGNQPVDALVADALLGQAGTALRQAACRPDPEDAARALVEVVDALADRARLSGALVDLASGLSRRLEDGRAGLFSLIRLAGAASAHEPERARRLVDEALAAAGTSAGRDEVCRWLIGLSAAVVGDARLADEVLDRAAALAATVTDGMDRARATSSVAAALAVRGRTERAHELWRRATDDVEQLADPATRAIELATIGDTLADSEPAWAQRLFDRAVALAGSVTDNWQRSFATNGVANRLRRSRPEQAASLALRMAPTPARDGMLARAAAALAAVDAGSAADLLAAISRPGARARAAAAVAAACADTRPRQAPALLRQAVAAAGSLPGTEREQVLLAIVEAVAGTDTEQATQIAATITEDHLRSRALDLLVRALVDHAPDQAQALAAGITDPWYRAGSLAAMARSLATDDPGRARQLVDEAERLADQVSRFPPSWELAELVQTVATLSPAEAIGLVTRIPGSLARVGPLATIASRVFEDEPERARELFRSAVGLAEAETDGRFRRRQLVRVVEAMVAREPATALELADGVAREAEPDELEAAARAVAAADPRHARGLLEAADLAGSSRCAALGRLARAVAEHDPGQARDLFQHAVEAANGLPVERDRWASLTQLAVLMRDSDPDGAAELAGTVAKDAESDLERSQAAIALAGARPERAARLIEEIGDDAFRGMALAELARSLAETDPRLARTNLDRAMATIPLVSSDDRPGQALAGAALSVAHGDAAVALQYLEAVPADAGRHIVLDHLAGAVLPDGSRKSADALAGYLLGSGRGNDPTGLLDTGGWTLPSTLQFVNGFLAALAISTPTRAPAIAQEVASVLERYWPAIP
jgi:tetratricopeptide (TPR) repeat protein